MDEHLTGAIGRREAIKLGAKVAGVTAFAAPTVVGVFSSPAIGQTTFRCNPLTESDAVLGTITSGGDWNVNCASECNGVGGTNFRGGRYNGQKANFTLGGTDGGTVQVGTNGVDNFCTAQSYYTINAPGYKCDATWQVVGCDGAVIFSTPTVTGDISPLPYCTTKCASVELELLTVTCCPV